MVGASKLKDIDVFVIKYLFERSDAKDETIAKLFGVSRTHIWKIRNGERWNDESKLFQMKSQFIKKDMNTIIEEKIYEILKSKFS
jgi:hypothetical protein